MTRVCPVYVTPLQPEQPFQILLRNSLFFALRQLVEAEYPGHSPVEDHVVGPVGAKDDSVNPDGIDQITQGRFRVDNTANSRPRASCSRRSVCQSPLPAVARQKNWGVM